MADPDTEETLARARQALANTLQGRECCASATMALRNQMISLISSEACQDMSLRAGGIHITGSMYRIVGFGLGANPHTYHVSIDPNLKKYEGLFDPRTNRFTFKFAAISGPPAQVAQNCETIIHECTHACVALTGKPVDNALNEALAWLGGVLYLRGQNLEIEARNDFRKNLVALADKARQANRRGQVFDLPSDGIDALLRDIRLGYRKDA